MFTKLFSSIIYSSVWQEPDAVRLVWITLMAIADRKGVVFCSIPGLASAARVSVEDCRDALEKFESPDLDSSSPEFDGRRIEKVDGGWKLLNYEKYRGMRSQEERREYQRIKQAEYRARKKPQSTPSPGEQSYVAAVNRGDQEGADRVVEAHLPETPEENAARVMKLAADGEEVL